MKRVTLSVDCVVPDFTGAGQIESILEDFSFVVREIGGTEEDEGFISMAMWRNEMPIPEKTVKERLEYLRREIENECISMTEIVELQGLADQIDPGDVLLLQWAGVPEA